GDSLDFPTGVPIALRNTVNDFVGANFTSITIDDVDYAFGFATSAAANAVTLGSASSPGTLIVNSNGAGTTGTGGVIGFNINFGGTTGNEQFFLNQFGSLMTLTGQLSGPSGVVMTKLGPGTLVLGGDNTNLQGAINVSQGTLRVTSYQVMLNLTGATSGTTAFTITAGAATTAPITFLDSATGATNIQAALNALGTIGGVGGTATVTWVSPGVFSMVFGGTLIGQGIPTLSATITTAPGTIALSSLGTGLGTTSSDTTVQTNAQLQIGMPANTTFSENLILNGPGITNDGALLNISSTTSTVTWAGNLRMDSDVTIGVAQVGFTAGPLTINGVISDLGVRSLTKEGPGTLTLEPFGNLLGNTYRGTTTVNGGILAIGHPFALGTGGTTANATTVNHSLTESGTLELAFSNNPQVLIDPQYYNYGVLQTLTLTGATIGSTQITLSAGNAFAAPITYTGVAATDQANIAAALTSLSTIGGVGGTATVTQVSPGVFNVLFGGGLAG